MRLKSLRLQNIKSLVDFEIENAPDVLVLAGPNGVGKSSILQAIVYLKESLGPYVGWQWTEAVSSNADLGEIKAVFNLCEAEKEYLRTVVGVPDPSNEYDAYIKLDKSGNVVNRIGPSELVRLFQTYDRRNYPELGVIDYIDPHRIFRRKQVTTLQVGGIDYSQDKGRRVAPGENKFEQLKEYLAQLKMADLQKIQREFAKGKTKIGPQDIGDSLEPIKQLFGDLIPSKTFVDVDISTAPVRFIIDTPGGEVDIDALSSGEKEVLFVFTELHKLKPKNSIILFDEPDLHLNDEIKRRIPSQLKSLGENNQIWIATHSLGLMNTVGPDELFKMENYAGRNQVSLAFDDDAKMETFRSVAGQTGIVTLGEKIVFLEGTEVSDKLILESWFRRQKGKMVFVSSGSLREIKGISGKVLDLLQTSSKYNYYYSIRDRDFLSESERDGILSSGTGRIFVWSKYHIENFLIEPASIFSIFSKLMPTENPFTSPDDCMAKMKMLVQDRRPLFLSKMVSYELHSVVGAKHLKISENYDQDALVESRRIREDVEKTLSNGQVSSLLEAKEQEFDRMIQEERWLDILPGRLVLTMFWNKYGKGMDFKRFKNLLVDEIYNQGRIPAEVREVVGTILHGQDM